MGRKAGKVGRNEPCPCGSGRKYKSCCWEKRFEYHRTEEGALVKSIPIDPTVREILEEQRKKFVAQFGREPGPDDKIFFDIDPEEHERVVVNAMQEARLSPGFIYAYKKTGMIVTSENQDLWSEQDLVEWEAAWDEWEAIESGEIRH
jgi:hypothetical protein